VSLCSSGLVKTGIWWADGSPVISGSSPRVLFGFLLLPLSLCGCADELLSHTFICKCSRNPCFNPSGTRSLEGPPWAEPFQHTECRQGAGPGCRQLLSPSPGSAAGFWQCRRALSPPLIHVSLTNCTAACMCLMKGLSSASQHWEVLSVARPVGHFVPHGLTKP